MVGDLEHVHPGQAGARRRSQQRLLRRWFEVAEQQQRQPGRPHEQGDTGVVRPVRSPAAPGSGGGHSTCQVEVSRAPPLPRHRPRHRDAPGRRLPAHELGLVRRLLEPRRLDRPHRPPPQHARQPRHMVGVEVGQHHQRDRGDAERAQAAVDQHRIGSRVRPPPPVPSPAASTSRVALPHVAHRQPPARRRPARDHPGQRCAAAPPPAATPARRPHTARGAAAAVRPTSTSSRGDERPAAAPPPSCPASPSRPRAAPRRHGRCPRSTRRANSRSQASALATGIATGAVASAAKPEHRGGRDRELRQQIARHRHQAHPGRQHGDHRRAHRLRGRRGRQRLGEPRRHPAPPQRRAPARGQREQGAGGEHGEQEPVTPRQPRVVQHQQQYGRGQRRDQRSAASGARWPAARSARRPRPAARSGPAGTRRRSRA